MALKYVKHTHAFDGYHVAVIHRDNPKYTGLPFDKAFVYRTCGCGQRQYVEYGEREAMRELARRLSGGLGGQGEVAV